MEALVASKRGVVNLGEGERYFRRTQGRSQIYADTVQTKLYDIIRRTRK